MKTTTITFSDMDIDQAQLHAAELDDQLGLRSGPVSFWHGGQIIIDHFPDETDLVETGVAEYASQQGLNIKSIETL